MPADVKERITALLLQLQEMQEPSYELIAQSKLQIKKLLSKATHDYLNMRGALLIALSYVLDNFSPAKQNTFYRVMGYVENLIVITMLADTYDFDKEKLLPVPQEIFGLTQASGDRLDPYPLEELSTKSVPLHEKIGAAKELISLHKTLQAAKRITLRKGLINRVLQLCCERSVAVDLSGPISPTGESLETLIKSKRYSIISVNNDILSEQAERIWKDDTKLSFIVWSITKSDVQSKAESILYGLLGYIPIYSIYPRMYITTARKNFKEGKYEGLLPSLPVPTSVFRQREWPRYPSRPGADDDYAAGIHTETSPRARARSWTEHYFELFRKLIQVQLEHPNLYPTISIPEWAAREARLVPAEHPVTPEGKQFLREIEKLAAMGKTYKIMDY